MTAEAEVQAPGTPTLDVSGLPSNAFGHRAPLWWGVLLLIAIESTAMGLLLVSYFYLRGNYDVWPPTTMAPGALRLAIVQAIVLGASYLPVLLRARAARQE